MKMLAIFEILAFGNAAFFESSVDTSMYIEIYDVQRNGREEPKVPFTFCRNKIVHTTTPTKYQ